MDWSFSLGSFSFGILDVVSFCLFLVCGIVYSVQGFSRVASKTFGWICCFPLALVFTSLLSRTIRDMSELNETLSSLIAFTLLSMGIFLVFSLLGFLLKSFLEAAHLGVLDKVLGFFFGVLLMILILSVLVMVLTLDQPFFDFGPLLENSELYESVYSRVFDFISVNAREGFSGILN